VHEVEEAVSTNGRASLQTVDARVARLEEAQRSTDIAITNIQSEQVHLRELMMARFSTIETTLTAQGGKLDTFIGRIENMILDATRSAGDISASPAGRLVHDRLIKLETKSEIHDTFIDQAKGMGTAMRWVIGSSLVGFLTGLAGLLKAAGVF
jgi:hypothetical protein